MPLEHAARMNRSRNLCATSRQVIESARRTAAESVALRAFIHRYVSESRVVLTSTITCPECRAQTVEAMPYDACVFFWECPDCRSIIRPKPGDCCVFCSYGSEPCPPKVAHPRMGRCCDLPRP